MKFDARTAPIGIFDSGVGGLTVLAELRRELPNEDIIYFGDEKNAPYGALTHEKMQAVARAAAKRLVDMGVKAITVACNTATAAAIDTLRSTYPQIPIIGTEPAVKVASDAGFKHILVLATPVTLSEERFATLVKAKCRGAEVISVPCPGLATLIEENSANDECFDRYLDPIFKEHRGCFDAIVLGCTHYPLIKTAISDAAAKNGAAGVPIIDSGAAIAKQVGRRLTEAKLAAPTDSPGTLTLISSEHGDRLERFWRRISTTV